MSIEVFLHSSVPILSVHVLQHSVWTVLPASPTESYPWTVLQLPWDQVDPDIEISLTQPSTSLCQRWKVTTAGRYAVFGGEVISVKRTSERGASRPVLLVTDLDDTLVAGSQGGREAFDRFARYWVSSHLFSGSKLVYSTGRSLLKYLELFSEFPLFLHPDCIVCGAGGEAYVPSPHSGEYVLVADYSEKLRFDNWDVGIVAKVVAEQFPQAKVIPRSPDTPLSVLREVPNSAKCIFPMLKTYLRNKSGRVDYGVIVRAKALLVSCGETNYLDIVPVGGGKRCSVEFARDVFDFDAEDTFVAGDSSNDISMLSGPENGIIPANCQSTLSAWFYRKGHARNNLISDLSFADAIVDVLRKNNEWQ